MQDKRRILKGGDAFLVMDPGGHVPSGEGFGLYLRDTRHLSRYILSLGEPLTLIRAEISRDSASAVFDLLGPEADGVPSLHLRRDMVMTSQLAEGVHLQNLAASDRRLRVDLAFGADFRDIFEVRGIVGRQHRQPRLNRTSSHVVWQNPGKDEVSRWTRMDFSPPPTSLDGVSATWELALRPKQSSHLDIRVRFGTGPPPESATTEALDALLSEHGRKVQLGMESWSGIIVEDWGLARWLGRSLQDAITLLIDVDGHHVPAAGLPWYATLFGRDSLVFGLQTVHVNPYLSMEILRALAERQGKVVNPARSEEPGKILHELRQGELAGSGQIPHSPYYGSVDATPLFLCLFHEVYRWTGDLEFCRELYPAALAAARLIEKNLEESPNGFLSYVGDDPPGLRHQGWKDSVTGILHPDGSQPEPPVAICEAQGYAYWGMTGLAEVGRALGREEADDLQQVGKDLQARFDTSFWMHREGTYALAVDGTGERVTTLASNPGHLLMCGILSGERARSVSKLLTSQEFLTGWGVRTVAASQEIYHPLSYHNGSVWPYDTSLIAWGMARHGLQEEAARLSEALFDAAGSFHFRLPELFGGFSRAKESGPLPVPRACDLQSWSAGTPFLLVRALLGLEADALGATIRAKPFLPAEIGTITLRSLRLGRGKVDLLVEGAGGKWRADLVHQEGEVEVLLGD